MDIRNFGNKDPYALGQEVMWEIGDSNKIFFFYLLQHLPLPLHLLFQEVRDRGGCDGSLADS